MEVELNSLKEAKQKSETKFLDQLSANRDVTQRLKDDLDIRTEDKTKQRAMYEGLLDDIKAERQALKEK